jgi:hypothetical protein
MLKVHKIKKNMLLMYQKLKVLYIIFLIFDREQPGFDDCYKGFNQNYK